MIALWSPVLDTKEDVWQFFKRWRPYAAWFPTVHVVTGQLLEPHMDLQLYPSVDPHGWAGRIVLR